MLGKIPVPRKTLVAAGAFIALLLATIAWSIGATFVNSSLQDEFEIKTRIMNSLRVQPVRSRNANADRFSASEMAIAAPTDTLAASELHKKVLASVEEQGGLVHSIQAEVTNNVMADGLRRINTQITFDSSIDTVQKALYALETSVPFIFVDSITIQPAPTSAAGGDGNDRLRVSLVVSSYWKTVEAPKR